MKKTFDQLAKGDRFDYQGDSYTVDRIINASKDYRQIRTIRDRGSMYVNFSINPLDGSGMMHKEYSPE